MMNKEYLKSLIDCVSGIECKHETQQIAKYELIEYVEDLQQRISKAIEYIKKQDYYSVTYSLDALEYDKNHLLEILGGKE